VLFYVNFATAPWCSCCCCTLMGPIHGARKLGRATSTYQNLDKSTTTQEHIALRLLAFVSLFQNNHHKLPKACCLISAVKRRWLDPLTPLLHLGFGQGHAVVIAARGSEPCRWPLGVFWLKSYQTYKRAVLPMALLHSAGKWSYQGTGGQQPKSRRISGNQ
jgi:hypothetical protein